MISTGGNFFTTNHAPAVSASTNSCPEAKASREDTQVENLCT